MTAPLARLTTKRDRATRALRRALRTTILGQLAPEERHWIERIESTRTELLADGAATGPPFDPGTEGPKGRFTIDDRPTTVGVAAGFMSLPPAWGLLLLRLVRELSPRSCLELGTAFGISTAFQAAALEMNGSGSLTTLEGSAEWAGRAEANLASLGLGRVSVRVGPISEALPRELAGSGRFDFAFIDAEHQVGATLQQFGAMLPALADGAVVVLDDVDWPDMRRAQAVIRDHERVSRSVSIGRFGVSVLGAPDAAHR
jgi:predicted O-methyltransferase YrrM